MVPTMRRTQDDGTTLVRSHNWPTIAQPALATVLVGLAAALSFRYPIATLFSGLMLLACMRTKATSALASVIFVVLFSAINMTKTPDGDLVQYLGLQQLFATASLSDLFEVDNFNQVFGSYRDTEFVFHIIFWSLATLVSPEKWAYDLLATACIYVPPIVGLFLVRRQLGWNDAALAVALCWLLLGGLNFAQTTHLTRQYFSASVLFLAWCMHSSGRFWVPALLAGSSILIHNGILLVLAPYLIVRTIVPFEYIRIWSLVAFVVRLSVATILVLGTWYLVFRRQIDFIGFDNGSISWINYALDIFIVMSTSVVLWRRKVWPRIYSRALTAFILVFFVSAFFLIVDMELLALRYYLYVEFLRCMFAGVFIMAYSRRSVLTYTLIFVTAILLSGLVFMLRIDRSPWEYASAGLGLFLVDIPGMASAMGR
jgi:hypothetical protein